MLPSIAACLLILDWSIRLFALLTVPSRHPPAQARTWLLLVGFLPLVGLPLYLLLSRPWLAPGRIERQAEVSAALRAASAAEDGVPLADGAAALARLARRLGDLPACAGNRIDFLGDYAGALGDLAAGIDAAQSEVDLLYYIVADDAAGGRVLAALRRAAARGVRCRLLVDALASKPFLRDGAGALRAAGIDVRAMLQDRLWSAAGRFDLRNHRKLAIVDGRVGWVGSQNLVGPDFIPGAPNVELVARVEGPIVAQLGAVFAGDWYIETGERLAVPPAPPPAGDAAAQMLPGGPAYPFENARDIVVALVQRAQREVVLCTPYFVPDEAVTDALCLAALSGVDVRLIVSARSNQPLVAWAQRAYYDELLAAGVRIHRFRPGFLHAKHVSVDGRLGLIGSINLDLRSFLLNAEAGLLVYADEAVGRLRAVQQGYLAASDELALDRWRARPLWQRSLEGLARLANGFL